MGGMAIAGYGASGPEFLEGVRKDVASSSVSSWGGTGSGSGNAGATSGSGQKAGLLTKDGVTRPTMNQAQAAAQFANLSQTEQSNYLNQLAAGPGGVVARQAFVDQYLNGVTPAGATMSPKTAAAAEVPNQGPYSVNNQTLNEIFAAQPVSTGLTGLNTGSTISTGGATPTGTDITEIFAEQPLVVPETKFGEGSVLPAFTGGIPTGTDITEIFAEQPLVVPETEFGEDSGLPSFITNLIANNPNLEQIFAEQPLNTVISKFGDLIGIPSFVTGGLGGLDLTTDFTPEELEQLKTAPLTASSNNQQGANTNESNVGTPSAGGAFDIANLAAIRSAVPGTYDPNRRAGSGGQRYFSDVQYAPQGGIAGSQAAANTQAMQLALANAQNPAYQIRPGNATDRATSMAQRAAGLAGLLPTTVTGTIPTARTTPAATTPAATTPTGTTTGTTAATGGTTTGGTTAATGGTTTGGTTAATGGTTTGGTTATTGGTTTTSTSPYTYTSESLFQGIDPSDGFDETEIGRVASLMNQDYTTADQVSEFFNMSPDDVNRYLGDYNTRATLLDSLGLAEGQTSLSLDQLNQLGDSGLATDYLASTFGVGEDVLSRAIEGAQTDRTLSGVNTVGGISKDDQNIIADLITSGRTDIGNVAGKYGVEGMDVVEGLLRGGYETPAEMAARLAPQNEGLTEVDLIANLLNTGRAQSEEIASYYRNTDPEQFADLTAQGVEAELAKINEQKTSDYLTGLSDEEVGALINSGDLTVDQAVELYQDRYPGLSEADVNAALKAQGYAQGGNVNGYYLGGPTDGMADQIPATINNMQPAALSDGEFVIPADVVSHLGNGNSDSGAKELYGMMERVRKDRTGNPKQGRQIDPNKYLA
jgi:hypothetical protein